MSGSDLLDLLADATHPDARVRFLTTLESAADPLSTVWSASEGAAGWIRGRSGHQPVVAAVLEASHESLATLVGAWRAGARVVSLPARARGQSMDAYRDLLRAVCALADVSVVLVADPALEELRELPVATASYAEAVTGAPFSERADGGDLVQLTSGTTGPPKAIVLDLPAVAANVAGILDRLDLPGPGVSCSWLPLSHDMGLVGMCLVPWAAFGPRWQSAGEMILIPTASFARNPSIWMRACAELGATVTTAPTFAYELVSRRLSPNRPLDLSHLRACIVGAEPVRAEVLHRFTAAAEPYGLDATALCPAYGLAEAALAVSLEPPGRPFRVDAASGLVSCGPPLDNMRVRIDNAGAGHGGSIEIAGDSLFSGYLGQPTPERRDGWHQTRDEGFELDGELYVAGRLDDVFFVGGEKISAVAVEQAAAQAQGARAGGAAAVSLGGTSFAVVIERRMGGTARQGVADLAADVRRTVMGSMGRSPSAVLVVPPGTLPRTPSGKIQRHLVRTLLDQGELEADAHVVFSRHASNTES
jgi:acyl-CoA synthetase (AMP-forming)/AMP-acid ligase II